MTIYIHDSKQIAHDYTENVYDFEWINDFSLARNYSFSKTTKEYQMWLDADDIFVSHKKESTYTDRNLKIYESQIQSGKKPSPRSLYYFARELKDHKRYEEAIY